MYVQTVRQVSQVRAYVYVPRQGYTRPLVCDPTTLHSPQSGPLFPGIQSHCPVMELYKALFSQPECATRKKKEYRIDPISGAWLWKAACKLTAIRPIKCWPTVTHLCGRVAISTIQTVRAFWTKQRKHPVAIWRYPSPIAMDLHTTVISTVAH